jgi:hypothetical protein
MQAPETLEEHVGRHWVCHEQVGIDVERLLQGLRTNDDDTRSLPIRPQDTHHLLIEVLLIGVQF